MMAPKLLRPIVVSRQDSWQCQNLAIALIVALGAVALADPNVDAGKTDALIVDNDADISAKSSLLSGPVSAAEESCDLECDWCWCGTVYENNCPTEWFYDAECDCGCQFCDAWCDCSVQDCSGGGPCGAECDYCWIDTEYENNCPLEWCGDGDCDCGCQFTDADCPGGTCGESCGAECDFCWYGTESENNCPLEWCGTDDGCDCGCQFTDADCPGGTCGCNPVCGDGLCEEGCGENCTSCQEDCDCGLTLVSAASRRLHGAAGTFDLDYPLSGNPAIEPRMNGLVPQMVLTYDASPADPGCGGVTVVNGTCDGTNVSGNDLIVDMTFDQNACVEISVGDDTVRVLTHTGNVNGDDAVNVIDLQDVKNHVFQPVDATNCVYDVNCDGQINVIDLQETKNNIFQPAGCD